jgi:hypothetical protein
MLHNFKVFIIPLGQITSLVYFPYVEKIKVGLRDYLTVCVYPHIVARQRLCKHVPAATNTHTTEELLDASFSMRSVSYQRKVGD